MFDLLPAPDLLLANAAVAFAAFIQTASGIGFAMIAVPLLALIDFAFVPGPSLLAMLALSLAMAAQGWREVDRDGLLTLLPGLVVGTVIGALALGALPASSLGVLFGSMILIALAVGRIGIVPRRSPRSFALFGTAAGVMGTMAGIHGPALVILYQDAPTRTVRATIALIFIVASCLSLISLYLTDLVDDRALMIGLALWPGVAAGYVLALCARNLIQDSVARRLMLGLATLSALLLIAKGLGWL